jgi:hypothetical protein
MTTAVGNVLLLMKASSSHERGSLWYYRHLDHGDKRLKIRQG